VTGIRSCDQKRTLKCDHKTRFIIQTYGWRSGGHVALNQLALAFADAAPGRSFVSPASHMKIPHALQNDYGELVHLAPPLGTKSLCPGDILIVPEFVPNCTVSWATAAKVRVFMWQLGSVPKKKGCQYIHHNHWLAHHEGHSLSRDRIITPYVSPHFVEFAHQQAGLNVLTGDISSLTSPLREKKRNLFVLIDDDVPQAAVDVITRNARSLGGEAVVVRGYDVPSLYRLYSRATLVFDWCMRGSERMALEASLFGALLSTNACKSGEDFSDYPIPQAFLFDMNLITDAFDAWAMSILARTRDEYWELLSSFAPMRLRTLAYGRASMAEDARKFIALEHSRMKPLPGEHMVFEEYFAVEATNNVSSA
jgi:hypothetical protein